MYLPTKQQFIERANQGNLIPVYREILADQETPVSAYEKLRTHFRGNGRASHTFLLESVEGGERIGRYSILGGNPITIVKAVGRQVTFDRGDQGVEIFDDVDPLHCLKEYMSRFKAVPDPALPRFFGGAVGYLGYDVVSRFEPVPEHRGAGLGWPDMYYCITDTLIIFDRVRHSLRVVANAYVDDDPESSYDDALERIESLSRILGQPLPSHLVDMAMDIEPLEAESNVERDVFMDQVDKTKAYIKAGDIIQAVLSQRFEAPFEGDPLDVYRALRVINPSPYMFCLEFDDVCAVGSSPEIHVRCEDRKVEVRPIAGTRPRSADEDEDQRLADELLADPKERAEHIMLVDLARNDIGRVCSYHSVSVPELMIIERYSHVMHIVSDVVGTLRDDMDIFDLMRATFPAGTLSGAPKVRAMQIIAEFEKDRRGPYGGAVGYFSFDGNLDSCITIRTVLMQDGKAYVQAGAGVVADSDPASEYEETRNKARGMMKALAMAGHLGRRT